MPRSSSSTSRRIRLVDFIDIYGREMLRSYTSYRANKTVCRVYIRSSRYSEYNRRNTDYDIKISEKE